MLVNQWEVAAKWLPMGSTTLYSRLERYSSEHDLEVEVREELSHLLSGLLAT